MEKFAFKENIEELNNEAINKLVKEINNMDNSKFDEKIIKLNNLKELIKQKEMNKDRIPVCLYYIKVRSLIKLTRIDEYDYNLFKQNYDFLGTKNNKNIERVLKK